MSQNNRPGNSAKADSIELHLKGLNILTFSSYFQLKLLKKEH